jgi:hypothetical protein
LRGFGLLLQFIAENYEFATHTGKFKELGPAF